MVRVLFFVFLGLHLFFFSQTGPRVWQDHISLNRCNSVAKLGDKIYASNQVGIVRFDEAELSPESVTKISGLHDVNITLLRTNPYNNKLLVIYQNCNIDMIDLNGNIVNYPDFKLKSFTGNKSINEVTFFKQFAYIACGFGIVLFDTEKNETKETFFIGPGGSNLEVFQVALNDSLIFAATAKGIYKSNYKTKVLNNFNNWKRETALPNGPYTGIVNCDNKMITAYSPNRLDNNVQYKDTLYLLKDNSWSKWQPGKTNYTISKIGMTNGELFSVIDNFGLLVTNINTGGTVNYITSYNGKTDFRIVDAFFGKNHLNNTVYWCADLVYGLYQTFSYYPFYPQDKVSRNGINQAQVNNIDVFEDKLVISPSHPDAGGGSSYSDQGINVLKNDDWDYLKTNNKDSGRVIDITYAFIDRYDNSRIWASSWSAGLMEFKNNKFVTNYNASNSSITERNPGQPRCMGIDMDSKGNLWFAVSDVPNYINVRKKQDGSFKGFAFKSAPFTRRILVDRNNFVWAAHERDGGLTVFKSDNKTDNFPTPVDGVNYRLLNKNVGNGNLQSNSVYSIAEDLDGKIWVGTDAGVVVFYNPGSMFTSSNFDAQPIKILQDGNVELLLGKEVVTSIVVDGANNKWIGTQTGGVYCFSPDGLTQLYHFTAENSPLYSNSVLDINYYEKTGDIFFGTEIGLQSFRSLIIAGDETYTNVYAYPNPVRPNYAGTVLVRGLVDNSSVKITDESGNLVWETISNGGQIEWNVSSFSGNRVKSGVYVVYASTSTAEQKAVTKILVVN